MCLSLSLFLSLSFSFTHTRKHIRTRARALTHTHSQQHKAFRIPEESSFFAALLEREAGRGGDRTFTEGVELQVDHERQFAWVTKNGEPNKTIFDYKLQQKKSNNKVMCFGNVCRMCLVLRLDVALA